MCVGELGLSCHSVQKPWKTAGVVGNRTAVVELNRRTKSGSGNQVRIRCWSEMSSPSESLWCQCVQERLREASVVHLLSDRAVLVHFSPLCSDLQVWGKRDNSRADLGACLLPVIIC